MEGEQVDIKRVRDWVGRLQDCWRRSWGTASQSARDRGLSASIQLSSPLRVTMYELRASEVPLLSTGIKFQLCETEDEEESVHLEQAVDRAPLSWPTPIRGRMEHYLAVMRVNWHPGRVLDPPEPYGLFGGHLNDTSSFRVAPGDLLAVPVERIVDFELREERTSEPTAPVVARAPGVRHLHTAGQSRERLAMERWLSLHANDLFVGLGLTRDGAAGWWCGLNLLRADVFGEPGNGDVDLIAGPLDFNLSHQEWQEAFHAEADRIPIASDPTWAWQFARDRAAREGRFAWPPRMDLVGACEVKASWFNVETDGEPCWKATHRGERSRVRGQLKLLLQRGLDRVAFLHLGSTEPRNRPNGNPWLAAGRDADAAELSRQTVFDPASLTDCGYFAAIMGAVRFAEEDFAGAGGNIIAVATPSPNRASSGNEPWRNHLAKKLGALPRPTSPVVFVFPCPSCGAWLTSPSTWCAGCACGWKIDPA